MKGIHASGIFAVCAFALITLIFLAVISPLKGLGVLTFPLIILGIGLWLASLIMLIIGLINREKEEYKKAALIIAILFIIAFIPAGITYMGISGEVRTKITIEVINKSDTELQNILIYGTGDLFPETDTLKVAKLEIGQKIEYVIQPSTQPQKGGGKKGDIQMEFDKGREHMIKRIAGEFSVYPLNIQQDWEIIINQEFFE